MPFTALKELFHTVWEAGGQGALEAQPMRLKQELLCTKHRQR